MYLAFLYKFYIWNQFAVTPTLLKEKEVNQVNLWIDNINSCISSREFKKSLRPFLFKPDYCQEQREKKTKQTKNFYRSTDNQLVNVSPLMCIKELLFFALVLLSELTLQYENTKKWVSR